jgi:putative transposase
MFLIFYIRFTKYEIAIGGALLEVGDEASRHHADRRSRVADVGRKRNCVEQSFYRWKKKFGGMEVSEAKRLRGLERENGELKRIVAGQTLDIRMSCH